MVSSHHFEGPLKVELWLLFFLTVKTQCVLDYLADFHYWHSTDQSLQIWKDGHTHLLIVEKKYKGLI